MNPNLPNILLIHWHDLGKYLGCYGYEGVPSPCVDQLSRDGVRFDNAFCTSPLCSPSRGSMFTGRYPHSNGLMGLVNRGWTLPSDEKCLQHYLKEVGYDTALIGFQHERHDPHELGFDEVHVPKDTAFGWNLLPYTESYFRKRSNQSSPFFLSVGFFDVHRLGGGRGYPEDIYPPLDPDTVPVPGFLKDTPFARRDLAGFARAIEKADAATGDILQQLKSSGLESNTIIIFTTDHGMAFPGAKSNLHDPGLEIALIAKGPGIPANATYPGLTSNVDILPTLLDLCDYAGDRSAIQGQSCLSNLRDPSGKAHRQVVFGEKIYHNEYDPVRMIRTEEFKLIKSFEPAPRLAIAQDIEKSLTRLGMDDSHLEPRAPIQLFDMRQDPFEQNNLAGSPEMQTVESELLRQLETWMRETHDPLLQGPIPMPA